jgi:NTP pyrophosphatase (non-canonical NTP hydrolase)
VTSPNPRTGLYGMVLSNLTLSAIQAEATGAHAQHGDNSMLGPSHTDDRRLAILTEEVGEVARELNDAEIGGRPIDRDKLVKELIQVAAMAATWVEALEGVGAQARRRQAAEGITGMGWDNLGHGGGQ